jgi:hypothetical protein
MTIRQKLIKDSPTVEISEGKSGDGDDLISSGRSCRRRARTSSSKPVTVGLGTVTNFTWDATSRHPGSQSFASHRLGDGVRAATRYL